MPELKALLKAKGLKVSGTKAALVERLMDAEADAAAPVAPTVVTSVAVVATAEEAAAAKE